MMSYKTRSHYLITEKCAQRAQNQTGDENWCGLSEKRKKAALPQTVKGRHTDEAVYRPHLGILVFRRAGDQGCQQFKPIIQWRSQKCTRWRGRHAGGSLKPGKTARPPGSQ